MQVAILALAAAILAGVLYLVLRRKPAVAVIVEEPPTPEPIRLLGVAIVPAHVPSWFDPGRWGPYHYALNVPLTFRATVHDPVPGDPVCAETTTFYLVRDGQAGFVCYPVTVSGVEWTWNGEGVASSCGNYSPIPMTIHAVVNLTDGTVLQDRRQFFLVPEGACRTR